MKALLVLAMATCCCFGQKDPNTSVRQWMRSNRSKFRCISSIGKVYAPWVIVERAYIDFDSDKLGYTAEPKCVQDNLQLQFSQDGENWLTIANAHSSVYPKLDETNSISIEGGK